MSAEPKSQRADLVKVAYAGDLAEAGLIQGLLEERGIPSALQSLHINGPQLGFGVLARTPQHVLVRAEHAEEARTVLTETFVENEEDPSPEPVNARYLDEAEGRKPRGYGLAGAYARIYLWSFAAMALAFGIFILLRAT